MARADLAAGADPSARRIGIIRSFLVTDDRDRDWPPLRAAERYRMGVYGRFARRRAQAMHRPFNDPDRITQRVFVGNVDECVDELTAFIQRYGLTDVVTWGSAPGLQPAALTPSMERFAAEVVPQVRSRLASTTDATPR